MTWNSAGKERKKESLLGGSRTFSMRTLLGVILSLCIVVSSLGCSSRRPPPPQMKLHVHTDAATNDGQLFYMLVRAVSDKQFLTESYQTVAGIVFADPPDKTVVGTHVILPGTTQDLQVLQPEESPVAFYFLFTDPGDQWKRILDQPLAKAYDIKIHKSDITITKRRSLLMRILWPFGS
jgi:predicted component of type VI protein secretion system